ncbi:putative uncharacterized protein DDB_G0277445 [Drosophila grimshawi]|uniref:putative uncharacterized protein DDB_G0277445 n=1 Tax=Drosophila grimshawi TaxID=7222 RepID=UPI000C86E60D|nr:putative uncharacterized protein DDB_G0277445 [Drosophila grimshawi]
MGLRVLIFDAGTGNLSPVSVQRGWDNNNNNNNNNSNNNNIKNNCLVAWVAGCQPSGAAAAAQSLGLSTINGMSFVY